MGKLNEGTFAAPAEAFRDRLRADRPDDADLLDQARREETVVVSGNYDHIGTVMRATKVPFVSVEPAVLATSGVLQRAKTVWINCPGHLPDRPPRRSSPGSDRAACCAPPTGRSSGWNGPFPAGRATPVGAFRTAS
jgi:hypothetical protein